MRVLIVDDHVIVREGLVSLLNSAPDFQVVGEAGTGKAAIRMAAELKPDLILMDFSLPDLDGATATKIILKQTPSIAIVFLTVHETDDRLFSALRSGAVGYLIKNIRGQKLLASLRALKNNEPAISRSMMMDVLKEFAHQGPPSEFWQINFSGSIFEGSGYITRVSRRCLKSRNCQPSIHLTNNCQEPYS